MRLPPPFGDVDETRVMVLPHRDLWTSPQRRCCEKARVRTPLSDYLYTYAWSRLSVNTRPQLCIRVVRESYNRHGWWRLFRPKPIIWKNPQKIQINFVIWSRYKWVFKGAVLVRFFFFVYVIQYTRNISSYWKRVSDTSLPDAITSIVNMNFHDISCFALGKILYIF